MHWQMSPPMNENFKKGDIVLAPLSYSSVVKVYWTAMIKRILVNRKLGEADNDLREKVNRILPSALAI
jgi:hypothetical protein